MNEAFIKKFSGYTEEYKFYNDTVTLRYEPEGHVYYVLEDGKFNPVEGVTTVCHVIDKSNALVPWAAKVTIEKLLKNTPTLLRDGLVWTESLEWEKFTTIAAQAKSAHKEHLDDAGNVGHEAHAWIERYIKAVLGLIPDSVELTMEYLPTEARAKNCCIAALDWMEKHNIRWISTERKVYSKRYKYAGTTDGLCLADSCTDSLCCHEAFKDRLTLADWKSSNYLYIEYLLQTAAYEQAIEEETGDTIKDRWIIRLGKDDGEFEAWHCEDHEFRSDFEAFVNALNLYRSVNDLEDRMKYQKDQIRAEKKRLKALAKEAALKIACKGSSKYKGVRFPHCNDGNPCETCIRIYNEKHIDKTI